MDIFLLGAGRPARGRTPSALKDIALNVKAMDWQIHSFQSLAAGQNIHYLGGYNVDDVIKHYPQLKFTVVPDWENRSVLHTFLRAPLSGGPVMVAYSDTVFRKEIVEEMLTVDADVVFGIDSLWKGRFDARSPEDIRSAETIEIVNSAGLSTVTEFTGLLRVSGEAAQKLPELRESDVGSNLIDLVRHLESLGFSVKPFDVAGHWAEFNSPNDVARFILGTKAETLARLEPLVRCGHIGKQVNFTCAQWGKSPSSVLEEIAESFSAARLVIRSSSMGEDNWASSNAGGFESLLNVDGESWADVSEAIETVIASYGVGHNGDDQILVQEFLANVSAAGVVFTCSLESGAPYYRFNFDDKTQSTESVTAGTHGDLRTVIVSRFAQHQLQLVEPVLVPVLKAVKELEHLLGFTKLDVEFAIDESGLVHIFQVRPIVVDHSEFEDDLVFVEAGIQSSVAHFQAQQSAQPFLHGEKTIFANMPDWNPAEIIGTRPKPLAFSLYKQLITNDIWAQQRAEFGYRDVRPCPLIHSFAGQPYVDARASLNSFIPSVLPEESAMRLATAYLKLLADNPQYHDKIEFDVAFTIWTPCFAEKARLRLTPYGVTEDDICQLEAALRDITTAALTRLPDDVASLAQLNQRRHVITSSSLAEIDKIFLLLSDCRQFGTLAFSHAARAGFVATTLLKSFVATDVLSEKRMSDFLQSFDTVAGEFEASKIAHREGKQTLSQLVDAYGHLRPGTYELGAQAYWEDPEKYIVVGKGSQPETGETFLFNETEKEGFALFLDELGSNISAERLIEYIVSATKTREYLKFEFSRNLSKALDLCVSYGFKVGISRTDLSYIEYIDLEQIKLNAVSLSELKKRIEVRKQNHSVTRLIELPGLIQRNSDFYCFERIASQPNFITGKVVEAQIQQMASSGQVDLRGKVVLIPQADPGYDWLFGHGIAGLITQYGGANSHMAIRAAEIGLPAAIGVGDKLYEKIAAMNRVELDCANQTIRKIK